MMIELAYRLVFNTPAFMGNADQSAQWRTPPIKALLRQWWRVAYVGDQTPGVTIAKMRTVEGMLFGLAADSGCGSQKSQLRLRLNSWSDGRKTDWAHEDAQPVVHGEVGKPVGAQLYLGYGPLKFQQGTALKARAAIGEKEHAELRLALLDESEASRLGTALHLLNLYGTLGGRSRNGWGSFNLTPLEGTPKFGATLDDRFFLPWRDALSKDWPHAIGRDDKGPLIWETGTQNDWKSVMRLLAEIKIGLRTQDAFKFSSSKADGRVHERHWLSYPVTHHDVFDWKKKGLRLPNSLRFKVRAGTDGTFRGVVFHMPCLPPPAFAPDKSAVVQVWQQVHQFLDARNGVLKRISA